MKRENIGMIAELLLMLLILLMLDALNALNAPAQAEEATQTMYVCVDDGSWLCGRTKPNTESDVEARFYASDTVEVYEIDGEWARTVGGESGEVWCNIAYLSSEPPETEPVKYRISANGRVRVRMEPDGDFLRWVSDGDEVQIERWCGTWAYIGDGYVQSDYLQQEAAEE